MANRESDYHFPEAYIEGVSSERYLIAFPEKGKYKLSEKPGEGICLGRVVYEEALRAFDLIESKARVHIAILLPRGGKKALFLKPGTTVIIYEVGGVQTVFNVEEGNRVRRGDVIAYVLTGKGETRSIRSGDDAVVFYIAWDRESHPPKYVVIMAKPSDIMVLEPG